ncbi:MAG TPA: glycerol-3-phosphate dehydrogenase/oxidase, partial [Anaerolineae bacterium]|nr:glycerol-3-phosphate dehydrogenase/oxidase [Anaerolineae bacterium]
MWTKNWREEVWAQIDQDWDVIVIGGGITGAGILREAGRLGLRALLLEQRDFAWGTSSRSSKLVHGGLRYLKQGDFALTRESVLEREHLLEEGPGLIDPLGFLLASYRGDKVGRLTYGAGLTIYDLLALQWSHKYYSPDDFRMLAPHISPVGLKGGYQYGDAETDDARLVLRVIREAVADSTTDQPILALNYACVTGLQRDEAGLVDGVTVRDEVSGETAVLQARLVINATGAWADKLRQEVGEKARIRPLRGSHLVFPGWRLPVAQAVSFLHPLDQRPVMIFPWEGVTLVGTTDVDHRQELDTEPGISPEEVTYLMMAVAYQFPSLDIGLDDVIATYAGVRPVISSGKADPSQESRDHVVWEESGLLTITGGKLTTFRLIALDALKAARHRLPDLPEIDEDAAILNPVESDLPGTASLDEADHRRLTGHYGAEAAALVQAAQPDELARIPGTQTLWAELRWAARAEGVVHLDDLLLRRVRLGLLLPQSGAAHMARIRAICQPELGWDDVRWETEEAAYLAVCRQAYSLPPRETIPDWQPVLAEILRDRETAVPISSRHKK